MAKTAVVNPRRRRKRRRSNPRRRRRNYGAAALVNPPRRRRRRRRYGAARRPRRRNPASPYASASYYRRPNPPQMFDFQDLVETVPAATAGIWAGRWAVRQAGAFEAAQDGTLEPGIKHAIAIWLAAAVGGQFIGQLMGSEAKGNAARVAALGYGGDLFLRGRFLRDSDFVRNNLSLQGTEDEPSETVQLIRGADGNLYQLSGFQSQSALGDYTDAAGNTWRSGPNGWEFVSSAPGFSGGPSDGSVLDGFQATSALGSPYYGRSSGTSFGYSPQMAR